MSTEIARSNVPGFSFLLRPGSSAPRATSTEKKPGEVFARDLQAPEQTGFYPDAVRVAGAEVSFDSASSPIGGAFSHGSA